MEGGGRMAYRIVSVFMFLIQLRRRDRRGRLKRLNEQSNNQVPPDSRKMRYDKPLTLPVKTVSLTHCMLSTGWEWRLVGGGRIAYGIVSIFMSSI